MGHTNLFICLILLPVILKGCEEDSYSQEECSSTIKAVNITSESFRGTDCPKIGKHIECVETSRCPQIKSIMGERFENFPLASVCNINLEHEIVSVCCEAPKTIGITKFDTSTAQRNSCGRQRIRGQYNKKIVGGVNTELGEFPWLGWIQYRDTGGNTFYACGASLFNSKWVLTAAHCIEITQAPGSKPTEVIFGDHDMTTDRDCNLRGECSDPTQVRKVAKTIVHPGYNPSSSGSHHDIALIKLQQNVQFTKYVQPICLMTQELPSNVYFWTSGWGTTEFGELSLTKLKVYLPRMDIQRCKFVWNSVTDNQICAGGVALRDSCQGDSGGPLMYENNNRWFLAGIVSYGHPKCGSENYPGVYTKVSSYINWINQNAVPDRYSIYNTGLFRFIKNMTRGGIQHVEF